MCVPSLRVGKRVLDWQLHVGDAELGDDRSVAQLDHGMHDRLRMHDDIDAIGRNAEQPVCLDDFQPFVHERR